MSKIQELINQDFQQAKKIENFEAAPQEANLNVMYFVHGTTDIMQDFSQITMDYIQDKVLSA